MVFSILYVQPITMGSIKISALTNGSFIVFSILYLLKKNSFKITKIGKTSIASALKTFFSTGTYYSFSTVLIDTLRSLIFPLTYIVALNRFDKKQIINFLIFFSFVIISSSSFFLLGILEPINTGYNLSIFGEDSSGFIGMFENSHSASVTLSLCLLCLIYFLLVNKEPIYINKNFRRVLLLTILFGLYVIYKTYIRTGYLTLIVGLLVFYIKTFRIKNILPSIILAIFSFSIFFYLYNKDETLKARLLDSQEYSSGDATKDLGSGRILFQIASIDIWINASFEEKVLGLGLDPYMEKMEKLVGLRIYAHNGFMTYFLKDGVIGLILYVLFIYSLIIQSIRSKSPVKLLPLAVSFSYLFYQMVQGGVISSIMEVLLALIYILLQEDNPKLNFNFNKKILIENHK